MKRIISDFTKHHLQQMISFVAVTGFTVAAFIFTGMFQSEKMWWQAAVVSAFLGGLTLWLYIRVLILAPIRFKKQFSATGNDAETLTQEYPYAKVDCCHRYMDSFVVFYRNQMIYAVRYSDITEIDGGVKHLFLTINGYKKTVIMPFDFAGPNAVAMAYIKSKNPDVKILCDRTVKDAN